MIIRPFRAIGWLVSELIPVKIPQSSLAYAEASEPSQPPTVGAVCDEGPASDGAIPPAPEAGHPDRPTSELLTTAAHMIECVNLGQPSVFAEELRTRAAMFRAIEDDKPLDPGATELGTFHAAELYPQFRK